MIEPGETPGRDAEFCSQQVPPTVVPTYEPTGYLRVRLEFADGVLRCEVPRTPPSVVLVGIRHGAVPVVDVQSLVVRPDVRPFSFVVGALSIAVLLVLGL